MSKFSLKTLLFGAALSLSFLGASQTLAEEHNQQISRIFITGQGMAAAAPDMATLDLSVLRQGKTAREALSANNEAMGKVLEALSQAGLEAKDIQTSGISIQPVYSNVRKSVSSQRTHEIVGYDVSNGLTIRIRNLEKLGDILDKTVTLGVNRGGHVQFGHEDPSLLTKEARKMAVEDAIAKAETLTQTAGVRLGRVLSMREQSHGISPHIARAEFAVRSAAADSVPIAAGETGYRVSVDMEWEILQ